MDRYSETGSTALRDQEPAHLGRQIRLSAVFILFGLILIGTLTVFMPYGIPVVRWIIGPLWIVVALALGTLLMMGRGVLPRSRPCATFRWSGPLPDDQQVGEDAASKVSDDFGEQWNYQATEPVARYVHEQLVHRGFAKQGSCFGDIHGWAIDVTIESLPCIIWVKWNPDGDSSSSFFMETAVRHEWFNSVFRATAYERATRRLVEAANDVLTGSPRILDIRWSGDSRSGAR